MVVVLDFILQFHTQIVNSVGDWRSLETVSSR